MKPRAIHMAPAAWVQYQFSTVALGRSAMLRRKVKTVAEISEYFDWQYKIFGKIRTVQTKPLLWKKMSARMRASGEQWHVLEFGVAYGHATQWWLSHHDQSVIATWDGFDRFTGLPRAWRGLPVGAFNANGRTPAINDNRIEWHVGDLENTIDSMDTNRISSGRRLVYFDFDIYEPSKIAWDWLHPHLRPGDILYFDEAVDADERRLLNDSILPIGVFDCLCATGSQLAIEVRALK